MYKQFAIQQLIDHVLETEVDNFYEYPSEDHPYYYALIAAGENLKDANKAIEDLDDE